jgi:hypothetical protein
MALAGGSEPAAKPAKAPAAPAQSSQDQNGSAGKSGGRDCPDEEGTSHDL